LGFFKNGGLIEQLNVIATATGTTNLAASTTADANLGKQIQVFTGVLGQIVVLPLATSMSVGQSFQIFNQSTLALTLEFNGGAAFTDAGGKNYGTINTETSLTITLQTNGTSAGTWAVSNTPSGIDAPGPTVQKFLSGSGTYTTPNNVSFITVRMVGGGGGGGGALSGTTGGTGGTTTFGTSLLTCTGGAGGDDTTLNGGAGGTATVNSPAIQIVALSGGKGSGAVQTTFSAAGFGAYSPFGGAGTQLGGAGVGSAVANTGSGGAGSIADASHQGSAGGGAGGYIEAVITSPIAYAYSVGTGGTGGTGTDSNGGNGGSGIIIVTEYYFNGLGASAGNGGAYTPTASRALGPTTATGTGGFVSGTYTTPANVSYIRVRMVGGGGGGGGSGIPTTTGGTGGNTIFGTSLLTANGGQGSQGGTGQSVGGTGGTTTVNSPAVVIESMAGNGGSGQGLNNFASGSNIAFAGGMGGAGPFGGAPNGIAYAAVGISATANSGAGGGGGGGTTGASINSSAGGGGGAGGFIDAFIIPTAGQTFAYSVGAGGTAGAAGSGGGPQAGGAGGSGIIEVTEYYNNGAVGTATTITGSVTAAQVLGTTAGGNAAAGFIGEFISANSAGVAVGSSGAFVTIASISLTAGDWDVEGTCSLVTGGTTAGTVSSGGVSLNPTSEDSQTNGGVFDAFGTLVASSTYLSPTGKRRINVSTTTTVYLVGAATYTVAGGATWGTNSFIGARRVR
jgi:hypothetical protein